MATAKGCCDHGMLLEDLVTNELAWKMFCDLAFISMLLDNILCKGRLLSTPSAGHTIRIGVVGMQLVRHRYRMRKFWASCTA